jgi:hypothetical protein
MPEKLERCVRKVKKKGGVKNEWAVCKAALSGKTNWKKGARKRKKK